MLVTAILYSDILKSPIFQTSVLALCRRLNAGRRIDPGTNTGGIKETQAPVSVGVTSQNEKSRRDRNVAENHCGGLHGIIKRIDS